MNDDPLVSAVIPTKNRPSLVRRAITSALSQSYRKLEVIVVVDGPDLETIDAIKSFDKSCVRVVALDKSVGGAEARNIGILESKGQWVAFLDDDDEWLPEKTEKQITQIKKCGDNVIFSACRYYDRNGIRSSVQPEVFPEAGRDIGEYLFCEVTNLGRRKGFLQTSTWIVRRDFCLDNPFTRGLKKNQDTDWLLRAYAKNKVYTCFVAEPCAIFHNDIAIKRISTTSDWKYTFEWANDESLRLTAKAKAYLYATVCGMDAKHRADGIQSLYFLWRQCDLSVRFAPQVLFLFLIKLLSAFSYRCRHVRASLEWIKASLRYGRIKSNQES